VALPEIVQWQARRLVRERPLYRPLPETVATPTDFVGTLRKLVRHRVLILLCTVVSAIVALAFVLQLPPRYLAEARVLVGVPEPRVLSNVAAVVSDLTPDAERVQSEIFSVESRRVLADVVERLHLAENPEFNPTLRPPPIMKQVLERTHSLLLSIAPRSKAADLPSTPDTASDNEVASDGVPKSAVENRVIDTLQSKLNVSALGRSNVLSIQAEAEKPDEAATIANTLADRYLAHQRNDKIETGKQVEAFLADRIAELRQQVQKSEQAVEDYRRQYGLYKGENSGVTSQQMTELNTQMILSQTAKAEADARLSEAVAMRKTGAEGDSVPDVLKSPLIAALKEQQAQTARKLSDLQTSYGPEHPKILSGKAELNEISGKIRAEINRVVEGLRHEASTASARYEALRQNFARLQGQMGAVGDKTIHLEALERDATVNRNLLESMLNRAKETVGQQDLQQANAKLISAASPPGTPAFPPKTLIVFLGTLGGALIGLLSALMRESADRTFRLGDQVEAMTGLPVLAMVPRVRGTPPALEVLKHPMSSFSEALRKLHIALQMSEASRTPKTVLFSSATPGEGKSVLAASLGRLVASHGRRVLLIDCDWRSPNLHRLFRCPNRGGLAALLANDTVVLEDIVKRDEASGADVITAGDLDAKTAHQLMSPRMQIILDTFARNYDLVIIDSPPVLVGADVLALCRLVEKVVYVTRWGKTRRELAFEGLKQIIEARGQVAGVVLSRVDPKRYRRYGFGNLDYQYPRPASARLF
jgi:capsular exopolysaccharide synthesis family protein